MKKKYRYYLALQDDDVDIPIVNVDSKFLKDNKISFYLEIPLLNGGMYTDVYSNDIIYFKRLFDLIESYMFNFLSDEDNPDDFKEEFDFDKRLEKLCENDIVLRKNIENDNFTKVSKDEILNCFHQLIDKYADEDDDEYGITQDEYLNRNLIENDGILTFLDTVESLIEKDMAYLTLTDGGIRNYSVCIMKENSYIHQKFKSDKTPPPLGNILSCPLYVGTLANFFSMVFRSSNKEIKLSGFDLLILPSPVKEGIYAPFIKCAWGSEKVCPKYLLKLLAISLATSI